MKQSNIFIKYNIDNSYIKEYINSFVESKCCSFLGCKNYDEASLYLNCNNILGDNYVKKHYNKFNIVSFGEIKLPLMFDNYITSYIYYNCENYKEEFNNMIVEYLKENPGTLESKIRVIANKLKLDYLICYTASNLFVYDNSKSIYIYSDFKNLEILTDNNLKYFKENKYNLIPQEKVNRFLINFI